MFVLQLKNEGCNNTIIEVLICELPINFSVLSFNNGKLNDFNSIRIDVESFEELYSVVKTIKNNTNSRKLSYGSKIQSKVLTVNTEANKIIEYIEGYI